MKFWRCVCLSVLAAMLVVLVVLGALLGPIAVLATIGTEVLIVGLYLLCGFYSVEQQTEAIVERWGQFLRVDKPGLKWRWCIMDQVAARISLRLQETKPKPETITKDKTFTTLHLSVQYKVLPDKVYDAYYQLADAVSQMHSYIDNVVRAFVPTIDLDDVFEKQDDLQKTVQDTLKAVMEKYGYVIEAVLVTDIVPAAKVKEEMNRINAAKRAAIAAEREGEAEKIKMIKVAEGGAESRRLAGLGIANERREIAKGIHDAREQVKEGAEGLDDRGVMKILGLVQYLDTLAAFAKADGTKTILVPHSPGGLADFERQLERAVLVGNEMGGNNGAA